MNRPAFFLVLLSGMLLGMLPYAAFLGSLHFAAIYASGSMLVALALTVQHTLSLSNSAENEPPSLDEHIHAVLGGAAYSASVALMGFVFYGLAYGLNYAAGLISDALRIGWQANPHSFAVWSSGLITIMFGLFAFSFSPIPRTLYPDVAGVVVSAYDDLLRRGRPWRGILLVLGGAAISIANYFISPGSWWWNVLAVIMIGVGGSEAMTVATKWSPAAALGKDAVKALQKLYNVLGYNTVISPRTEDSNADVDSFMQWVDMFASSERGALAIELKMPTRTSRAVSAADASILPIAARVMSRYLTEEKQPPVHVQPVLVLVGRAQTADLAHLAAEEDIRVLSFTEDALREVLKTEDENSLRELAHRYLLADSAPIVAANTPRPAVSPAS